MTSTCAARWRSAAPSTSISTASTATSIIDFTDVDTLDVTAARVLAYATMEAGRAGQHLRLRGCGPAVRRMLQLSRLARFIEVERAAATA